MLELYALALKLCFASLIPNPHTVANLPVKQQEYIVEAVMKECKKETEMQRLMYCVEVNFEGCENE